MDYQADINERNCTWAIRNNKKTNCNWKWKSWNAFYNIRKSIPGNYLTNMKRLMGCLWVGFRWIEPFLSHNAMNQRVNEWIQDRLFSLVIFWMDCEHSMYLKGVRINTILERCRVLLFWAGFIRSTNLEGLLPGDKLLLSYHCSVRWKDEVVHFCQDETRV